jgi:RimJ/RimL family protein N-acetyltransferase
MMEIRRIECVVLLAAIENLIKPVIHLKPLFKESITPFYTWLNDELAIKYSLTKFQKISSKIEIEQWYSRLLADSKNYTIGIFLTDTEELIGYAGICGISEANRSGEYFIFIGDRNQWGKGFGTITTHEILKYGFDKLNLNRIMLTVSEPNKGGIRAYLKAGFKFEGRLRQACYRDGKFHDKIIMSVLRSEYC